MAPAHMAPHGAAEPFLGTKRLRDRARRWAPGAPFSLDMASRRRRAGQGHPGPRAGRADPPGAGHRAPGGAPTHRRGGRAGRRGAAARRAEGQRPGLRRCAAWPACWPARASRTSSSPMSGGATRAPAERGQLFLLLDPWRLAHPRSHGSGSTSSWSACTAQERREGFRRGDCPGERGRPAWLRSAALTGSRVEESRARCAGPACLSLTRGRLPELAGAPPARWPPRDLITAAQAGTGTRRGGSGGARASARRTGTAMRRVADTSSGSAAPVSALTSRTAPRCVATTPSRPS
jgi:hypothetical protein